MQLPLSFVTLYDKGIVKRWQGDREMMTRESQVKLLYLFYRPESWVKLYYIMYCIPLTISFVCMIIICIYVNDVL